MLNIQGDIIKILDVTGRPVVEYIYDAWGNHAVLDHKGDVIVDKTHIGHLNPIRYRGYYYDTETNLYFLKTRYYDPEVGRFISQDSTNYLAPEMINGLNLYAYCGSNPVMRVDPMGTSWFGNAWNSTINFVGGIGNVIAGGVTFFANSIGGAIGLNPMSTISTSNAWFEFQAWVWRVTDTINAFGNSLVFDFSLGSGIGIGADSGLFSFDLLYAWDFLHFHSSSERIFDIGSRGVAALGLGFLIWNIGYFVEGRYSYITREYTEFDTEYLDLSIGFSAYLLLGYSISLGLDYQRFWREVKNIWNF